MNTQELLVFHDAFCVEAKVIMAKKNHDYAGASGQTPFANFEIVEKLGLCKTETGILIRIQDKMMRLATFVNAGQLSVKNESAVDACQDILNYVVLLAAYIKQKESC